MVEITKEAEALVYWNTVCNASYGTIVSRFRKKMTYEEAETMGKDYCTLNNLIYVGTCLTKDTEMFKRTGLKMFEKE